MFRSGMLSAFVTTSLAQEQWGMLSNASWPARGHFGASVSEDGVIMIAGGIAVADNSHLNDVWISKDGGSTWQQQPAAPWEGRHRHGVLQFKGCSYVIGGTTTHTNSTGSSEQWNFNDVWRSCDSGASWDVVTENAPWTPREGFGYSIVGDRMVILGGTVGGTMGGVSDVWASPDGKDWEMLKANDTNAWSPRYATTAVTTSQGELLLMGGFPNGGYTVPVCDDVWASADGGRSWELRSAEWQPRDYVALATLGNVTYLFGGQGDVRVMYKSFNDVWATTDGSDWNQVSEFPAGMKPRGGMPVVNVDGRLLVLGGNAEMNPHEDYSDVWRFTPSDAVQTFTI